MNLNEYDKNLIGSWEVIEFRLEVHSKGSLQSDWGSFISKSQLRTFQSINEQSFIEGICLEIHHKFSGESECIEAWVKIPNIGIEWEVTKENSSFGKLCVSFFGVKIIQVREEAWQFSVNKIRVLWDETEEVLCDFNWSNNSIFGPSSLPLIGSFPILSSECQVFPIPVLGFCEFGDGIDGQICCNTQGGWRVKDAKGWKEFPIKRCESTPFIESNHCGESKIQSFCKMSYHENLLEDYRMEYNFFGCKAEIPEIFSRKQVIRSHESKGGEIGLIPDLKKTVHRLNSDYVAVVKRDRFPNCLFQSKTIRGKTFFDVEKPFLGTLNPIENSLQEEIFRGCGQQEIVVHDHLSKFEDPFECPNYAPIKSWDRKWTVVDMEIQHLQSGIYFLEKSKDVSEMIDLEFSDQRWIEEYYKTTEFPVLEKGNKKEYALHIWHQDSLLTYVNSVIHPHWSYFFSKTSDSVSGMQNTGCGWTLNPQVIDQKSNVRWGWNKVVVSPFEMASSFQSSMRELWSLKQGKLEFKEGGVHVY